MNHFVSHPHPLRTSEVKDEGGRIQCFCCEQALSAGPCYICTLPDCHFFLHDSCFQLPHQIEHSSHPDHPLTLVPKPKYADGKFCCDACSHSGTGLAYHCFTCDYDLHPKCSRLPETVKREDHEHPLTLHYSPEPIAPGITFVCDVCWSPVPKSMYYCPGCVYCTHLGCVHAKASPRPPVAQQPAAGDLAIQQLQMIQLQEAQRRNKAQCELMLAGGRNAVELTRPYPSYTYTYYR